MTTPALPLTEVPGTTPTTPRPSRTWRFWLAPRPFTLVTTYAYVMLLVMWFDHVLTIGHPDSWLRATAGFAYVVRWPLALVISSSIILLVIDRIDAWMWGDTVPRVAAVVLLLVRVVLTTLVAYGLNAMTITLEQRGLQLEIDAWYGMYAYCLLPYVTAFYFGPRVSTALAIAILVYAASSLIPEGVLDLWRVREDFFESFGTFAIVLLFVSVMAKLVHDEMQGRVLAERLVHTFVQAKADLQRAAHHVVVATTERQRIAGSMHEALEHMLLTIATHIDTALREWDRDRSRAEQAVQAAKHVGSTALQEVRKSVRTLRSTDPEVHMLMHRDPPPCSMPSLLPPWLRWFAPRRIDLVILIWCMAVVVVTITDDSIPSREKILFNGVLLALLVLDRLEYWLFPRHRPLFVTVILMAAHLGLIGALMAINWWQALVFVLPFIPYIGFLYGGKHGGQWLTAFTWVVLASAISIMAYRDLGATSAAVAGGAMMLSGLSFMLLVMLVSLTTVLEEQAQRTRVEQTITWLERAYAQRRIVASQVLVEQKARNHLARDMHDGLGHYLTVINVQLEKALAFYSVDPTVADRALQDARRLTDDALREVRDVTATFTTVRSFSLPEALTQLVQHLKATCAVDLQIVGDLQEVSEQAQLALYRVAQEGITNIQKHAQATQVTILLVVEETNVQLLIRDNGCGFEQGTLVKSSTGRGGGYGLTGMQERLEIVGGSVHLETRKGMGTCLRVQVPKQAIVPSNTMIDEAVQVRL